MKSLSLDRNIISSSNASKRPNSIRSQTALKILKKLKKTANMKLKEKYHTDRNSLNKKIVNDIIYNEKSHVVAQFKDHLIFDDTNEFLRRSYNSKEALKKLPSIFDFYESYSKIFANYIILPESKYMYKNIQRKQKMIDNLQKMQADKDGNINENDKIFNTEIYNSIMNQTTQYEEMKQHTVLVNLTNPLVSISPSKKDDSYESIEGLIDSIGKAEKNNKNLLDDNFITINSNISETFRRSNPSESNFYRDMQQSQVSHFNRALNINPLTKVHSPSPSLTVNSNILISNINSFNKNTHVNSKTATVSNKFEGKIQIEEKNSKNQNASKIKSKVTPSPNIAEKFEKIILSERGEFTDRGQVVNTNKLFTINGNNILSSKLNGSSSIKTVGGSTLNPKPKLNSQSKPIIVSSNTIQGNGGNGTAVYYKVTKIGNNHKSTYSMPKLPTKEIINNLIGNYQSTLASSVDKNLLSGSVNSKLNLQVQNSGRDENSVGKAPNSSRVNDLGGLVTSINSMITNINNISSKDSKDPKQKSNDINKVSSGSNNDYLKYVSSYTSDVSKIKKKVASMVSDSNNNGKLNKKNSLLNINTSGGGSKYTSLITSNANTISASNTATINANNMSHSKIKNGPTKRDLLTGSLTSREIESLREKNSIRALLHRDLFVDGDVKSEKVVKKTNVVNTKVNVRSQSKIRDNLLSRNSIDKILLENSKERHLAINTSNTKNITQNEKKIISSAVNNQVSSPKNSVNKYNVSNRIATANKLNNNFLLQSTQSVNYNLNEYKNIRRNTKNSSAAIKSISNVHGNLSNISNIGLSSTPNKQCLNGAGKNMPGPLIIGENVNNVSNILNNQNPSHAIHKVAETARKLQDSKVVLDKPSNNANNASKQILKIKNFFEVVKNGTISSNSNSTRITYKKPELSLNPYKIKSMVK